jgi:G3E family GTPase
VFAVILRARSNPIRAPMLDLFRSPDAGMFGRRLRRERGARVPVTIVTGFLGAGKTTLVRHFLVTPAGAGTAVVVNEFGEAGIDDVLLRKSAENTVLLGNGCLCCNVRSDLQTALRRLVAERTRGRVAHFARVLIETSGLADPSPILATFATDRALGDEFCVEAVVMAADAKTGAETLDAYSEARRQAILADRIVLTKTDLLDDESDAADRLSEKLRALNPRAEIVVSARGEIDPRVFLEACSEPRGFVAEAAHSDGIQSFVLTAEQPIAWDVFARAMEVLVALRGGDLLRVKGFLHVAGARGPVLVQFVQHLAHAPVELETWPDGLKATRLVFITRGVTQIQVERLLAAMSDLSSA